MYCMFNICIILTVIIRFRNTILIYYKLSKLFQATTQTIYHFMILHTSTKSVLLLALFVSLLYIGTNSSIYQFKQKSVLIPHPQKAARGGQDAYYSDNQLLIVADGVGGWNDIGINPANYSRFLCYKGSQLFHSDVTYYRQNLIQVIAQTSRLNQFIGSSTMVVLTLDKQNLKTCYLGDSGFAIFRLFDDKYKLYFEFKQQQHSFNFPFQLARKDLKGDDPYLSICQNFKIQQNDIIIAGSDGLFDNIYVTEMLQLINMSLDDEEKLFGLSQKLAQLAIQRGQDKTFWSPFAQKAKQQMLKYSGGKLDDTTVIISKIQKIIKPIQVYPTDEISIINKDQQDGTDSQQIEQNQDKQIVDDKINQQDNHEQVQIEKNKQKAEVIQQNSNQGDKQIKVIKTDQSKQINQNIQTVQNKVSNDNDNNTKLGAETENNPINL